MELTMEHITAQELHERMRSDNRPVLINALPKEAFRSKRIPGSINLTTDHLECAEHIIPDKAQDIVVYCANEDCDASPELAEKLTEMGYKNVWDFDNGMAGWRSAGYGLIGNEV